MAMVARALNRTLVLPRLFNFAEDGSDINFVRFGAVYDEEATIRNLERLGISATTLKGYQAVEDRTRAARKACRVLDARRGKPHAGRKIKEEIVYCSPDADAPIWWCVDLESSKTAYA